MIANSIISNGPSRFLGHVYMNDVTISGSASLSSLSLSGTLSVTGATTLSSTLTVTGASTFNNWITTANNYGWKSAQGGGWYMTDANYVRSYGKPVMMGHNLYFNGTTYYINTSGNTNFNTAAASTVNAVNVQTNHLDGKTGYFSTLLRAAEYDFQVSQAQGGKITVAPTLVFPNSGTSIKVTKSSSTLTFTITDSTLTTADIQGITWKSGAKILVSGSLNDLATGTMDGTISSITPKTGSATAGTLVFTITASDTNGNSSQLLDVVASGTSGTTYSSSQIKHFTVMVYNVDNFDVGIELNCYGDNSSMYLQMMSGKSATPVVRLGNLTNANLPAIITNGLRNTPTGYGLFATNTYLQGAIISQEGQIGGWTIGDTKLYNNTNSMTSTDAGIYLGTDGIRNFATTTQYVDITGGKITALGADIRGAITANSGTIGGITANSSYGLYTNSKTSATSTNTGFLISKDGAIYLGAYNSTDQACPFQVTSAGVLTAKGAVIKGTLTAGADSKIGPWTVTATSIYKTNATMGNATAGAAYFGNDGLSITDKFKVSAAGAMTATSGSIAGWSLNTNSFATGTWGTENGVLLCTGSTTAKSIGGSASISGWTITSGAKFGVTKAGVVYGSDVHLTGEITATSGTIGGASITNGVLKIDAANINGTLTASQIGAGTITADKLAASAITVGGRNLIRGSRTMTIGGGSHASGTFRVSGSNGTMANTTYALTETPVVGITSGIVITSNATSGEYGFAQDGAKLKAGTITFSIWMKGSEACSARIQPWWTNNSGVAESFSKTVSVTTSWARYTITGTMNNDHLTDGISICYVYLSLAKSGLKLYTCAPMMEYGNFPSDWSPSPDEVAGFTVDNTSIYSGTYGSDNSVYISTANMASKSIAGRTGADWRFTVGSNFGVTNTGATYASSLVIGPSNGYHATTDTDGFKVYNNTTLLSSFGTTTQIGATNTNNFKITSTGIQMSALVNGSGSDPTEVFYVGVDSRTANAGTESNPDATETTTSPYYILGESGYTSTVKPGAYSFAVGKQAKASGSFSIAMGFGSVASKTSAISIGPSNATGVGSIAIGTSTSSAYYSYAIGNQCQSTSDHAFSLGFASIASATSSYAFGYRAKTTSSYTTALGKYNNPGDYALMVGKGTSNEARSNALTLDWNGNLWIAGGMAPSRIATDSDATAGNLDPLTSALIGSAASNKSFGLPAAAITVEYSTDGGSSWTSYGATNDQKRDLFNETRGTAFYLGKATAKASNSVNNRLRVTIEPTDRYVTFHGIYVWWSTQGNTCYMTLERSTIGAKDTFTTVFTGQQLSGWSGNNIRYFPQGTFGGNSTQTGNNYKYRITFYQTAINSNYPSAVVNDIRFIGSNVWTSPNYMVSNNRMYTWDRNFNVTFPASVKASTFSGQIFAPGQNIVLGTSSSSSNNSGMLAWAYGSGTEKMSIWAPENITATTAPYIRMRNSSGTILYNGTLVLADGTGASGTWDISVTGSSASCTGNAATATTASSCSGNAATATKAYVTNTTPSSATTYYLTYTNSTTSGNQDLRNSSRLYYYDTGTTSYLNVGNSSKTGGLTLHNANGKYGNLIVAALTDNRTYTFPDVGGTIALTSSDISGNAATATSTLKLSGLDSTGAAQSGTSNRPTTANIHYGDNGLRYYLATSSMTTGKPSNDAKIIHMPWDNGAWDSQLALVHNTSKPYLQIRSEYGTENTWSSWATVLDSNNYNSYAPTKTGTGASGTWGISITGNVKTHNGSSYVPVGSGSNDGEHVAIVRTNAGVRFVAQGQFNNSTSYSAYYVNMTSSDIRLKENIKDTSVTDALSVVNKMKIREFDWKCNEPHQKIGFIADELEELDSNLTLGGGYDEDGEMIVKSIDTLPLNAYMVKAIQELSAKVEEQAAEIERLKAGR